MEDTCLSGVCQLIQREKINPLPTCMNFAIINLKPVQNVRILQEFQRLDIFFIKFMNSKWPLPIYLM